jgi:hypothetical protein
LSSFFKRLIEETCQVSTLGLDRGIDISPSEVGFDRFDVDERVDQLYVVKTLESFLSLLLIGQFNEARPVVVETETVDTKLQLLA